MEKHYNNIPDKENRGEQQPEEAIWNAAVDGDWNAVKQWLELDPLLIGVRGHERSHVNTTLLHLAAENFNIDVLKFLVSKGADVNAKDKNDETPLHYTIRQHYGVRGMFDVEVPKYLISHGANIHAKDCDGMTPLYATSTTCMMTTYKHYWEYAEKVMKCLLLQGAEIDIKNELATETFLCPLAVNDVEILKHIISQGVDINVKDANGRTLLHRAVERPTSNMEVLKCLVSTGANVYAKDKNGNTPLDLANTEEKKSILCEAKLEPKEAIWKAATDRDWETVKRWLERDPSLISTTGKMDIEVIRILYNNNPEKLTLLHLVVCESDDMELPAYLISLGANVHAEDNLHNTPLHYAAAHNSNVDILKYLVSLGADADAYWEESESPLHYAAAHNSNVEVLKYLVSQGAELNDFMCFGAPRFYAAAYNSNVEILKYLLSLPGAGIDDEGCAGEHLPFGDQTLLHHAAQSNPNVDVLKHLILWGADVHAKDEDGQTPLHLAVMNNANVEVAKYLISQGADINIKDFHGKTPLELLIEKGRNIQETNNDG